MDCERKGEQREEENDVSVKEDWQKRRREAKKSRKDVEGEAEMKEKERWNREGKAEMKKVEAGTEKKDSRFN